MVCVCVRVRGCEHLNETRICHHVSSSRRARGAQKGGAQKKIKMNRATNEVQKKRVVVEGGGGCRMWKRGDEQMWDEDGLVGGRRKREMEARSRARGGTGWMLTAWWRMER